MNSQFRQVTSVWRFIDLGLFYLAGMMCLSFVYTSVGLGVVCAGSGLVTAVRLVAGVTSSSRAMRTLGRLAWLGNGAFHLFACYLAVAWAPRLSWTLSWWVEVIIAALFVAALATRKRQSQRPRIPIALPIGVLILACLLGWQRSEGVVRCDDYLKAVRQRGVQVLFPPDNRLIDCTPGQVFDVPRYPRNVWESPDSRRYVATTTPSSASFAMSASPIVYDGLFCEVAADGSGRPRCLGGMDGKVHKVEEIEPLDQIFACAWGVRGHEGHIASTIFRLSRSSPLTILEERVVEDDFLMYGFYQPKTDEYHIFTDECGSIWTVRGKDFSVLPKLPVANCPGATLYDANQDEGVMCGGFNGFAAFRLLPWAYRSIGNPLGRVSMSWGCDWDRATRKVYGMVPNLGLLAVINYDTGQVEQTYFVGFSLRAVAFDGPRQRIYATDFLGGEVLVLDARTGAEIKRQFVGHFSRELQISRDRSKLLTTSNLGVVRIDLDTE